jgi:hypothetical protein
VTIISIISAIVLLIGAVIVLYFVTNPKAQLTILCGWTAFFALTLGLLTNARRQDVFAATAAYAAVLVVFVSGNLGSQANSSMLCHHVPSAHRAPVTSFSLSSHLLPSSTNTIVHHHNNSAEYTRIKNMSSIKDEERISAATLRELLVRNEAWRMREDILQALKGASEYEEISEEHVKGATSIVGSLGHPCS